MNEQEESGVKKPGRLARLVKRAIAGIALITALKSYYIVDQTKQAVVTRFGDPVQVVFNNIGYSEEEKKMVEEAKKQYRKEGIKVKEGAGPKLKCPWDRVKYFDRRLLRWDGLAEQINTKEKVYILVDDVAMHSIIDPLKFLRTVKTEIGALAKLNDIVDSATINAVTESELIEIVRTTNREMEVAEEELKGTTKVGEIKYGRGKITERIMEESREACKDYGILVHHSGVLVKGLKYVDSIKDAVEARMISERTRIAEKYKSEGEGEYEKIMGDKEKELKRIKSEAYETAEGKRGDGDKQAIAIYADGLSKNPEFYEFTRTLQVYETALDKNTRLLLGTDTPFLRYLKGEEWTGEGVGGKVGKKTSEKPAEAPKQ